MKLVWAIVQNEDAGNAVKALTSKGYRTTRINTVGGLLRRGNVTILAGVEPEQVEDVVATLREQCKARQPSQEAPAPLARAVVFVIESSGFLQL
jgi:uncharacterized protein YaaQ